MIPHNESVKLDKGRSFHVGRYSSSYFERSWHYHHEYELLLITSGFGKRVVGDNTNRFEAGDLLLIGSDLPHAWFSDAIFFEEGSNRKCESIYVQFNRSILGTRFAQLPEMKGVQGVLNQARYGLKLKNAKENSQIIHRMMDFPDRNGLDSLLELLAILDMFGKSEYEQLVSQDYLDGFFYANSGRIKKVHEYVMNHFMEDVSVENAAKLVEMNVSSFCRYFKRSAQKTFSQFVKEIRIDYAQQLLINTDLGSNQIGFECGFSSIAYFNQCFKSVCGISPLEYRAKYKVI